jgi:hypothetical protein
MMATSKPLEFNHSPYIQFYHNSSSLPHPL